MRKSTGKYPKDWKEIAKAAKDAAGWKCERCGHPHEVATGYVLTVHHLDFHPKNNQPWNLAVLCQRCHLSIQSHYQLSQAWLMDFSEPWMKKHQDGFYAWVAQKVKEDIAKTTS